MLGIGILASIKTARFWLKAAPYLLGLAALIAAILLLRSCGAAPAEQKAAAAKVEQAKAETNVAAARDATQITGNTMDATAAIDRQTEVNHEAIRSGDGSDAIALRALCMRRAYHDQPRCAGMLNPGTQPAGR
jgi:hypothetical protein